MLPRGVVVMVERRPPPPPPALPELEPFERLGPYLLLDRLGNGGMGEVWMARRQTPFDGASKVVAIKVMSSKLAHSVEARRLFESEARLSMMLTHSNIVQMFDVGMEGQRAYLAMEWVDGLDLATVLRVSRRAGEAIDPNLAAYVIGEVLHALSYAHGLCEDGQREAVLHRDISPQNILTSVSGEVKLTDFGIARLCSEETTGNHVRGKLRYMPPEQLTGGARSPASDLFAVGAVLHEMLSGEAFRADIPTNELYYYVSAGLTPTLEREGLPAALCGLVDALLAPEVEDRLQSAEQALAMLRRWSGYSTQRSELGRRVLALAGLEGPRSGLSIEGRTTTYSSGARRGVLAMSHADLATRGAQTERCGFPVPEAARAIDAQSGQPPQGESAEAVEAPLPRDVSPSRALEPVALGLLGLASGVLGVVLWFGEVPPSPDPSPASTMFSTHTKGERCGEPLAVEEANTNELAPPALTQSSTEGSTPRPPSTARETSDTQVSAHKAPTPSKVRARRKAKGIRSPQPEASALPSTVTFTSGEFHWLRVAIGERRLTLDPRAQLRLAPGRYRVALRDGEGSWEQAGELLVEAGLAYRVDFTRSGGFRVTTMDSP
ncbi:putative serine/threonine protein kinase [Plesiocystis pacifica SIR-1]|uniref:Putative serine/threonine protein kinase n=2 Tax=Plesiocystis pacifica TaxID=191768 RepID=A6G2N4_9BACT|nr:putative serine/threonine protein kinase [Plesiocystis pacifica SIR-1]